MSTRTRLASTATGILALLLFANADGMDMNKSIKIDSGSRSGGHSTVNGSITVGSEAIVDGSISTVNGTIRIDANARVRDAETVNGSIRMADGVTVEDVSSVNGSIRAGQNVVVEGEISVVNGKIDLDPGTRVAYGVSNVNGEITITGAEIGGSLSTVNGDVMFTDNAALAGDLVVEKPGGWGWDRMRKPKIVIGPGATVAGELVLEREVELFISDSASVGGVSGEMSLDDAVRFSGNRP